MAEQLLIFLFFYLSGCDIAGEAIVLPDDDAVFGSLLAQGGFLAGDGVVLVFVAGVAQVGGDVVAVTKTLDTKVGFVRWLYGLFTFAQQPNLRVTSRHDAFSHCPTNDCPKYI